MTARTKKQLHEVDFDDRQWDEIVALCPEPMTVEPFALLTREMWMAIAHMAIGKAVRVERGDYDMGDEDDRDNAEWAADLNLIADTILAQFQPGDGVL